MADAGRPLSTEQTRLLVTLVGALSAGGDALVLSSIIARLGISEADARGILDELVDLGALLPGLTAGYGLQILRASLFMLNHMKTFEEARVSVASDGPGAKRQHR